MKQVSKSVWKRPWVYNLVVAGSIVVLFALFGSIPEVPLVIALSGLFMLKEAKRDERTKSIIYSSAYNALLLSLVFFYAAVFLYEIELTASKFLIVLYSLANIFRYSRQYVIPALGLNKRKGSH